MDSDSFKIQFGYGGKAAWPAIPPSLVFRSSPNDVQCQLQHICVWNSWSKLEIDEVGSYDTPGRDNAKEKQDGNSSLHSEASDFRQNDFRVEARENEHGCDQVHDDG